MSELHSLTMQVLSLSKWTHCILPILKKNLSSHSSKKNSKKCKLGVMTREVLHGNLWRLRDTVLRNRKLSTILPCYLLKLMQIKMAYFLKMNSSLLQNLAQLLKRLKVSPKLKRLKQNLLSTSRSWTRLLPMLQAFR